jgi:hypothetical protein
MERVRALPGRKEANKMRKLILPGVLALALAGCQNVAGPFAARPPQRPDDPSYSIPAQQARGPDESSGMPQIPGDVPGAMPPTRY